MSSKRQARSINREQRKDQHQASAKFRWRVRNRILDRDVRAEVIDLRDPADVLPSPIDIENAQIWATL